MCSHARTTASYIELLRNHVKNKVLCLWAHCKPTSKKPNSLQMNAESSLQNEW